MLDVNVAGTHHQEMHSDGGTVAQVFVFPPSINAALIRETAPRRRVLYVIRNARFELSVGECPPQDNDDRSPRHRFADHHAGDR